MPIIVACECSQWFEASEGNSDGRARCPACGRELVISKGGESPLDPAPGGVKFLAETTTSRKAIAALVWGISMFFCCLVLILPAISFSVEAARRSQCVNNLKQIGLAMHKYLDSSAQGNFPSAAIVDADGKPLLSWRVTILPFVGEQTLFNEFHLNEPWDSSHNKALLPRMPAVYRCPSEPWGDPSLTNYQVVVGSHTMFARGEVVTYREITDGIWNTIMVAESKNLVPWTKPEDLVFDPDGSFRTITVAESKHFNPSTNLEDLEFEPNEPLPAFGSGHADGFNIAFADGSVRFLESAIYLRRVRTVGTPAGVGAVSYQRPLIGEQILKALLTRDGGEMLGSSTY